MTVPGVELATTAASTQIAIQNLLRNEFDEWVRTSLRQCVEVCDQLKMDVALSPNVVNSFHDPEVRDLLLSLDRALLSQEDGQVVLEDIVNTLRSLVDASVEERGRLVRQDRTRLERFQRFFSRLGRELSGHMELAQRLNLQ